MKILTLRTDEICYGSLIFFQDMLINGFEKAGCTVKVCKEPDE